MVEVTRTWAVYIVLNNSDCPKRVDIENSEQHSCGHIDRIDLDDISCVEALCPLVRGMRS